MKNPILFTVLVCGFLTGCFTPPFKPPEMVPVGDVDPHDVAQSFARKLPDRQETEDSLVFRFLWKEIAVLGMTRVDREARAFEAISLNHLGVPLFQVSGDAEGNHLRYALPEFKKYPQFTENTGNDIRRIHFDLVPAESARAKVLSDRVLFRERCTEGTLDHIFGGQGNLLIEKRLTRWGCLRWRVNYYEYAEADGYVYPRGIVLYNVADHYRLIVRTRGITFDLEEKESSGPSP